MTTQGKAAGKVGRAYLRAQDTLGWAALTAIGVIGFANSYRHVAALFVFYDLGGGWQYPLAAITELLAVGYSIEVLRRWRIAGTERPPMLLPMLGIGLGLSMTMWANLASAVGRGLGGILTAGFSPICTLLVMATIETARRKTVRKAAPARVAPAAPPMARKVEPEPVPAVAEPAATAPTPVPAQTPTEGTRLTGRFAAAAQAREHYLRTGEWLTVPGLRRLGHSEGSARRGLEMAQTQEAGDEQSPALRVVNER